MVKEYGWDTIHSLIRIDHESEYIVDAYFSKDEFYWIIDANPNEDKYCIGLAIPNSMWFALTAYVWDEARHFNIGIITMNNIEVIKEL